MKFRSLVKLSLLLVVLFIVESCEKQDIPLPKPLELATVNTLQPTNFSLYHTYSSNSTQLTTGGNVLNDGGAQVTERGVCWSTSPNPTKGNNNFTIFGSGTGNFIGQSINFAVNTNYHFRAYAINSVGVSYGNEIIYTSPSYYIGQQHTSGYYIVHIDNTGLHGIMASTAGTYTSSSYAIQWGCMGTLLTGCNNSSFGSGPNNTTNITLGCNTWNASSYCDSYTGNGTYNDWYLPSSDEFDIIQNNLKNTYLALSAVTYWTSTQFDANQAICKSINNSNMVTSLTSNKNFTYKAIPIRNF